MEIGISFIVIIASVIGFIFMVYLTIDLIGRYRSNRSFMKNSPNRWNIFLEWFFWLTIILLLLSSLGEWIN